MTKTKSILLLCWQKILIILKYIYAEFIQFPLQIISHPIRSYQDIKECKRGRLSSAIIMVLIFAVVTILRYSYDGIIINVNDPTKFNSLKIVIYTVAPVVLLCVANWSITTLMNGKGKMKEIFMMGGYAYFPLIICGIINLILSNILTVEEAQFIVLINVLGYVIMGYMIFMGFIAVHEYGVFKSILTALFTAAATCVILFIALLIFDLAQQIYGFLYSLYREIVTRFF